MEKYTSFKYGKRKTWIMVSLVAMALSQALLYHKFQKISEVTGYFLITAFAFLIYTIALQPLALK
mgnify:CR=1 FL=1